MKDEAAFWGAVRRVLHQPQLGRVAWKIPAEIRAGLPDVWFSNIVGASGWIELKYVRSLPRRPGTAIIIKVTPAQTAHLCEAGAAGAAAYLLVGVGRRWYLLPARHTRPVTADDLERLSIAAGDLPFTVRSEHALLSGLGTERRGRLLYPSTV